MMGLTQDCGASLFGTDGIRERVGEGFLAPHHVQQIATAAAAVLTVDSEDCEIDATGARDAGSSYLPPPGARSILIARDTRSSGKLLFQLLSDAFVSAGFTVRDLGELPTPAVSLLAGRRSDVALGIVISASHNPSEYNGIKFFSHSGEKASDAFEAAVSKAFWIRREPPPAEPGTVVSAALDGFEQYVRYLIDRVRYPERLRGKRIVLDTANGATYRVAPAVFRKLGMRVSTRGAEPNGENINLDCGALYPQELARLAVETESALGFSFDGDGDRMIPVGAAGTVFDGDHVLLLSALRLVRQGLLPAKAVVATTMSNLGLERALQECGLELVRTDVGDRHVYAEMLRGDHPIGGEQSGHTIYRSDARTGDGILSALWLLDSLVSDDLDLEAEASILVRLPQVILNVRVREKLPFEQFPLVLEAVGRVEEALSGCGRVVLRYSGTEPLARVMVEAPDPEETERLATEICDAIRASMS